MAAVENNPTLAYRKAHSTKRIEQLKVRIAADADFPEIADLCIYVTGSYGRLEASEYSDLDIFFMHRGSSRRDRLSNVDKALLDASLIRAARTLGFPEFTKGGIYLTINYVDDILEILGSPRDDFENVFTARMLLLLESIPISNTEVYHASIDAMVNTYYRDYHDHEKDFEPIFFVNDIQRFWKTMCLNYEHARNRTAAMTEAEKNKSHLKNLKLKFSRMLICYSMVLAIITESTAVRPNDIIRFIHETPVERLVSVSKKRPALAPTIQSLLADYAWFLDSTGRDEGPLLAWIGDRAQRDAAFDRARQFGRNMYEIIQTAAREQNNLRYLVV